MSFYRRIKFQAPLLEKSAQLSWAKYVLRCVQTILQKNENHVLIKHFREEIQEFIQKRIPLSLHEKLLQEGLHLIVNEFGRDSSSSKMAGILISVLYTPPMKSLELVNHFDEEDRLRVLDHLNNLSNMSNLLVKTAKIKMFQNSRMQIEENYLMKVKILLLYVNFFGA